MGSKAVRGFHGEKLQGPWGPRRPDLPAFQRRHLTHPTMEPGCLEGPRKPLNEAPLGDSHEGPPHAPPQPPSGQVPGEAAQGAAPATLGGLPSAQAPDTGHFLFQGDRWATSQDCAQHDVRPRERCHPPPCGREGERGLHRWQVRGLQPGLSGRRGARVFLAGALPPPVPTTAKQRTPATLPGPIVTSRHTSLSLCRGRLGTDACAPGSPQPARPPRTDCHVHPESPGPGGR